MHEEYVVYTIYTYYMYTTDGFIKQEIIRIERYTHSLILYIKIFLLLFTSINCCLPNEQFL